MDPDSLPRPRPAVRALPAYVAGRRSAAADVAALASNESHLPPLPGVVEAISRAAATVNRYPDMATTALRTRLAELHEVDLDQVAVGPGSVGVLSQLLAALCDEGDDVVFAWRSFEAYPILCRIAGANPVAVPLLPDERHDLAGLTAAITPRTRAVLLCSPNNPTGTAIGLDELVAFLETVPTSVLVVLDEAYREYAVADLDTTSLLGEYPNLCLLRTFSKAWGLAGVRVGYALARAEVAEGLRRTQVPFSVSSVGEAAALAALDAADEVAARAAAVVAERDRVEAGLRRQGWEVPPSEANFVWLRCSEQERERLVAAFDDAGVMVRGYAGDGVRITLADPASNDRVLAVLAAWDRERG